MKLSFDWLNDFADFRSVSMDKILEAIRLSICELDDMIDYRKDLETIVAVKILNLQKHADAQNLSVCKVTDGNLEYTVVTAATNVKENDIVPLAKPGTKIGEKLILEASLRGVMSFGMFCSKKELQLAEDASGVYILDTNTELGISMRKLLGFEDLIFDIDNKSITHRPDLWSHFGFARELSAQLNMSILCNPFLDEYLFDSDSKVSVIANNNALAYNAVHITGVQIQESNFKIKSRLEKCNVRSINNVVDVSNYLLLEMGLPTHFFDRNTFQQIEIEVSPSLEGESILLLDGSTKTLSSGLLLIRNQGVGVALAGVMGGEKSSVQNHTKELILESAVFRREDIRKSIRATGLRTDAAIRYEKGLDPNYSIPAIKRSLNLLKQNNCPNLKATTPSGFAHDMDKKIIIHTSIDFINRKLGTNYSNEAIIDVLKRLYFDVKEVSNQLEILVPFFRHNYDVTIAEDIVEEIGRTMKYHTIEKTPLMFSVKPAIRNQSRELERRLKQLFSTHLNYNEVYNYSFASELDNQFESTDKISFKIQNEMPDEHSFLRNSTYPSIIRNVQTNLDRFDIVKIFEFGRVYEMDKQEPKETKYLSFGVSYNRKLNESIDVLEKDLLIIKNEVQNIFGILFSAKLDLERFTVSYFHPSSSFVGKIDDVIVWEMGYVHPFIGDRYELKKRLILGRIYFDRLLLVYNSKKNEFKFKIPSNFPTAYVDISLIMDKNSSTESYYHIAMNSQIPEIESGFVHDVYLGANIESGKQSVTYRFQLVTHQKTFTQDRIKSINDSLIYIAQNNGFILKSK